MITRLIRCSSCDSTMTRPVVSVLLYLATFSLLGLLYTDTIGISILVINLPTTKQESYFIKTLLGILLNLVCSATTRIIGTPVLMYISPNLIMLSPERPKFALAPAGFFLSLTCFNYAGNLFPPWFSISLLVDPSASIWHNTDVLPPERVPTQVLDVHRSIASLSR